MNRWKQFLRQLAPKANRTARRSQPAKRSTPLQFQQLEERTVPTVYSFTSAGAIALPGTGDVGNANPYPSTISATGFATGEVVRNINVTLTGLTHANTGNLDFLLVSPDSKNVIVLSDAGDFSSANNVTLTIDDQASATIADLSPITAGTYKPTNLQPIGDLDSFPGAPGNHAASLSTFNGIDPSGSWKLYIVDDSVEDVGTLASWTLTIDARTNTPPVPVNDPYLFPEGVTPHAYDATTGVLANDTDAEMDTLSATLVSGTANGTLTFGTDGSFTYTPELYFAGIDTFTYSVSDGVGSSATLGTVTLTVTNIDQAPVGINDAYVTIVTATNPTASLSRDAASGVLGNDKHSDGNSRQLIYLEDFESVTLKPVVRVRNTIVDASAAWTDELPTGYTRSNTDNTVDPVVVTPVSTPPAPEYYGWNIWNIDSWISEQGQSRTDFTKGGAGKKGRVFVADGDGYDDFVGIEPDLMRTAFTTRPISLRGVLENSARLEFDSSFRPENGSDQAIASVSFDNGATWTQLLDYKVDNVATVEYPNGRYPTGDRSRTNEHLVFNLNNPADAQSMQVRFFYKAGNDWWWAIDNVQVTGHKTDRTTMSAVKLSDPVNGIISSFNADGSFTYVPTANFTGVDTFTYKANDTVFDSAVTTVSINVLATNPNAPVANADFYSTLKNVPLNVIDNAGVLANDTDANADPLTVALIQNVTHGTLTLNSDGGFLYTPNLDFIGTDTFTYKANDTKADSAAKTVTIKVRGNDPIIVSDGAGALASINVAEGITAVTTVQATDLDVGQIISYSISGGNDRVRFTIDSNTGALTFNSTSDYENPADQNEDNNYIVTVRATDNAGLFDEQTITVRVANVIESLTIISGGGLSTATYRVTEHNTGVAGSIIVLPPVNPAFVINTATASGNTATITTSTDHGFAIGQLVTVSGVDESGYNGTVVVTAVTANTFTYTTAALNLDPGTGGSVVLLQTFLEETGGNRIVGLDEVNPASPISYSISGDDAGLFTIDMTTGALSFITAPNFEVPTDLNPDNNYQVSVTVTNGFGNYSQALTIQVIDFIGEPKATNESFETLINTQLAGNVLTNDSTRLTLLSEGFEGVSANKSFRSPSTTVNPGGASQGDGTDWTSALPTGWTRHTVSPHTSNPITYPVASPVEFHGFKVFDVDSWVGEQGDQNRSDFLRAGIGMHGQALVADGDAYDDGGSSINSTNYKISINSRPIDLTGVAANSLKVEFDSSFRPETPGNQKGIASYSFDNGTTWTDLITLDNSPNFSAGDRTRTNFHYSFNINNAGNEASMLVRFYYEAGNAWWWAVDNVQVTAASATAATPTATLDQNVGNGNLVLNGDGSFTYTPTTDYVGADSFTYHVVDGSVITNVATVSLNVIAPRHATIYYTGTATPGVWDTTALNFRLADNTPTNFQRGDNVVFDDNATGTTTITLTESLLVDSVMVDTANTYTFVGAGSFVDEDAVSNATLTKSGAGTLIIATNNVYTGLTTISSGTLQIGNGGATGTVGSVLGIVNNGALVFNTTATTTINSIISGSGSLQLVKSTLVLGGTNTYSGGTTQNNGTLTLNNISGLGTGSLTVTGDTAGTTLFLNAAGVYQNNIAFSGTANRQTIRNNVSNITTELAGVISGGAVGKSLFINFSTNSSSNVMIFSNPLNTVQGFFQLNRGVLQFNNDGAVGDAANEIVLDTTASSSGSGLRFGSAYTLHHKLALNDDSVINTNGFNVGIDSVIRNSGGNNNAVPVIGTGSLTLSGSNTFVEPVFIVANTKLILANTTGSATGTANLNLFANSTLGGAGGSTTGSVSAAGNLNAGDFNTGSTGAFTVGSTTFTAGGTVIADIRGITGGAAVSGYDQVLSTGAVDLSNASLQVTVGSYLPIANIVFTILSTTGTRSNTFTGLNNGDTVTATDNPLTQFVINYTATAVTLTSIAATPTIASLSPATGPAAGGTSVIITGAHFAAATQVVFGGSNAASFVVDSDTQITATSPLGTGTVDVRVTTAGGQSAIVPADQFTYVVALSAPTVTVNDGQSIVANQPSGFATFSRILKLELTFTDTIISVDAGAFSLFNGTDTVTNNGAVAVSGLNGTILTLTFTGTNATPGEEYLSLADGIWALTTDLTKVHTSSGAGTGSGVTNNIRRLFGDVNGTGTVDGGDFGLFGSTFGLNDQDPSFNAQFDVNADGSINGGDFGPFGSRFGTGL